MNQRGILTLAAALLLPLTASAADTEALANATEAAFLAGKSEQARALIATDTRLVAWRQSASLVRIDAVFHSRAEGLELILTRRPGVTGACAVAFEPGTFGEPEILPGELESHAPPQDVALLRAPVLTLKAGERRARRIVPVACAKYARKGPKPGRRYRLNQFKTDSPAARLMQVLCAGTLPADQELALAIWVAREGLTWEYFKNRRFRTFSPPRQVVQRSAVRGMTRLLRKAGLTDAEVPFLRDCPASLKPPAQTKSSENKPQKPESKKSKKSKKDKTPNKPESAPTPGLS